MPGSFPPPPPGKAWSSGPVSQWRHSSIYLLKWIWLVSAFLHLSKWPHFKIHTHRVHIRTFHIWFLQCNGFACSVMVSCTRRRNVETYGKQNQLQQEWASSHHHRFLRDRWIRLKTASTNWQNGSMEHQRFFFHYQLPQPLTLLTLCHACSVLQRKQFQKKSYDDSQ